MKRNCIYRNIFMAASIMAMHQPASAAIPLGIQGIDGNVYQQNNDLSTPIYGEYSTPYSQGYATANALGTPFTRTTASAVVPPDGSISANAAMRAGLTYWIGVTGPNALQLVPIIYISQLSVNTYGFNPWNDYSYARSDFVLQSYTTNPDGSFAQVISNQNWYILSQTRFSVPDPGASDALTVNGSIFINSEQLISTSIQSESVSSWGASANAFANSRFYIDPTFASENPGYSLIFSPFVGSEMSNGAIPEPGAWALLIVGFGLVGAALRIRRSRLARRSQWTWLIAEGTDQAQ